MTVNTTAPTFSLQELVDRFAGATVAAYGQATATHAGVAAVLDALVDVAQSQAAANMGAVDNRSLYAFAARLQKAIREPSQPV